MLRRYRQRHPGDYIGTDRNGTVALPNDENGININSTSFANQVGGTEPGAGNLISGNTEHGIDISDGGGGVSGGDKIIQGNLIGTDASGTVALGNGEHGVLIENSANNIIGGTVIGARNVISANGALASGSGIAIDGSTASGNQVLGNFIGTDILGSSALGNDQYGVLIREAPDNTIGGATPGAGNVLSANAFGIQIVNAGATGNVIQGNLIGTDASGTNPLGNSIGILPFSSSSGTIIGGPGGAGNTIAYSTNSGITLNSASTCNQIVGNSIFSNGRLGIDLGGGTEDSNGVTATGIPPDGDLEPAILATLDPGAYTAIMSGVNGGIGVGLVEAYDLSATDDERLPTSRPAAWFKPVMMA